MLGRARRFFRSLNAASERRGEYFSVACPQGHQVRGERTEGYQALRCPACGEGVFVLPISPLPEPPAPAARPSSPARGSTRRQSAAAAVAEGPVELTDPVRAAVDLNAPGLPVPTGDIPWEEEVAEPKHSPAAPTRTPRPVAPAAQPRPDPGLRPPQDLDDDGAQQDPSPRRSRSRRGIRLPEGSSPLTLEGGPALTIPRSSRPANRLPAFMLAAVLVLVIGTVALRTWRSHRQNLPQIAELGRTEGIPALEAGDFDHAYQLLSAAKEAIDSLGGGIEDADEVRQAAAEAAIFVDLIPQSLEEMLDEAARASPQTWATRFDNVFKGHAVILDATISAVPGADGSRGFELDYLVLAPGESSRVQRYARIDLSGLEVLVPGRHRVGDRVALGVRLASFGYDAQDKEWVIRLEPRSGVLIQHVKALESLGWPGDAGALDEPPESGEGP